jgi:PhoPQ-activated pathogenicity-related protein
MYLTSWARPSFRSIAGFLLLLPLVVAARQETALDRYVHAPDPAYAWQIVRTIPGEHHTAFILEMTSQSWLTTNEVDRPVWKHWLTVIRPDQVRHNTALLFIGGGSNDRPAPKQPDPQLASTAVTTASVVAELHMVPNQPLTFTREDTSVVEDELIATTWDRFLRTGDERWPARLPMTKSAVRAMDTITALCASKDGGKIDVSRFFVAGGSKRGWTTWTTAAVDPRVVAIAPIVIDLLNLGPSFIHHYEVYGFYAPAVHDYEVRGIMEWQGTPEYTRLLKLVEPYEYRDRLTMPKFIINATGDQFFVPDSSQFYFDELPGEKYLRYVPNGEHSLEDTDAFETLAACYSAVLRSSPLPKLTWKRSRDGSIRAQVSPTPEAARLWQATNPDVRDFRVDTIGKAWTPTTLALNADGIYVGRVPKPERGWTAFLLEFTFKPNGSPTPLKLTTEVRVVPDTKPFTYKPPEHPPTAPWKNRVLDSKPNTRTQRSSTSKP